MNIKDKYMLTTKRTNINVIDYWINISVRRSWFVIVTIVKFSKRVNKNRLFYKQLLNALYGRGELSEIWGDLLECEGNTSLSEKL